MTKTQMNNDARRAKSYCQHCVWETHPTMLTTYLPPNGGWCDRCHAVSDIAIVIPRPTEFELTVGDIMESIGNHKLNGAVYITGHTDPDGVYHNFIMYRPNTEGE